jgi:hypothetical protein
MYKDVAKNTDLFIIKYPKTIVPSPSENDYKIGFINRYFLTKTNEPSGHIFEVAQSVYIEYIKNPFWTGDSIKWRLIGPINEKYNNEGKLEDMGVNNSNLGSMGLASKKLKNISLYLPNPLQFYRK